MSPAQPFGGFYLNFSAPMKLDKEFRKRFTITPKPPLFYEDEYEPSAIIGSRFYRVNFSTEPSMIKTTSVWIVLNIRLKSGLATCISSPALQDG